MAVAEWFFSTLAQSTAAIIGFTIALAAALYTARLEKIRHQREILRERFTKIQEKYHPVLYEMATTLRNQGDFNTGGVTKDIPWQATYETIWGMEDSPPYQNFSRGINATKTEIREWVGEQDSRKIPVMWAHSRRLMGLLDDFANRTEDELTPKQMKQLFRSVDKLKTSVKVIEDSAIVLHAEITGEVGGRGLWKENIFNETDAVEAWLDKYLEDFNNRHINFEVSQEDATGRNIESWAVVFEELERDIELATSGTNLLDPKDDIQNFLKYAVALSITGIFLPLTFLISSNDPIITLPEFVVFSTQILILGASIVLSGCLVKSLFRFLRTTMS